MSGEEARRGESFKYEVMGKDVLTDTGSKIHSVDQFENKLLIKHD